MLEEGNNRIGGEYETLKVVATDPRASLKYNYHSSVLFLQIIYLYENKSWYKYLKPAFPKRQQMGIPYVDLQTQKSAAHRLILFQCHHNKQL